MCSNVETVKVNGETYEYTCEKPWRDKELMEAIDDDMDLVGEEIGEALGCSDATVYVWAKKHGVKDLKIPAKGQPVPLNHMNGYPVWNEGQLNESVLVHRLLAVAEYGYESVKNMDVHHKNGHKLDNRPENIELRDHRAHGMEHSDEQNNRRTAPWREKEKLYEMYVQNKMSQKEIADECDCTIKTIRKWMRKHNIEVRSKYKNTRDKEERLTV